MVLQLLCCGLRYICEGLCRVFIACRRLRSIIRSGPLRSVGVFVARVAGTFGLEMVRNTWVMCLRGIVS